MPGDPGDAVMAQFQAASSPRRSGDAQGLRPSDAPLWQQYFDYLNNLLHGNLCIAISAFPPVIDVIRPVFLDVAAWPDSTIIAFLLGNIPVSSAPEARGMVDRTRRRC